MNSAASRNSCYIQLMRGTYGAQQARLADWAQQARLADWAQQARLADWALLSAIRSRLAPAPSAYPFSVLERFLLDDDRSGRRRLGNLLLADRQVRRGL